MSKTDKINKPETMRKVVDATKVKKIVAGTLITATLMGSTTGVFADSKYENLDYLGEGYISVAEEVGPQGNGGFISSGVGDAGGISYGMLQLTSKAGGASANKFAFTYLKNEHPTYYKFFEGVGKAGTKSFSDAWTKAYNHNPGEFEKIQLDYKDITYVKPAVQLVKDAYGIDLLSSRARTEWVHATSVQFGPGGVKEVVGKAGVNNDMDDVELISKLNQEKRDSVGTYKFLGCSQSVRKSVYNRFNREEKEMIKIAKEEAGDSLEDVLKEEVKKDEEVVTAIETDDVVIDIVDDKTDTSDEKVEDTEKEETMEDESIIDEEEVNNEENVDEDESIIDEEEVNNEENVDEDNSIVDEEEVDNENIDEDDSIIDSEESDTDKVDTEENTDEDNSVVDEEVDTDEDVENVEGDNSVVDDSVLEDEEADSNDNADKDDSIESEDTENKTESEDKENSEVEKEESVENETMEDESIIDDSNIEDADSNNDKAEDTSDKVENDKVDQSDEDTNNTNTNVEEDKSEEVQEDTNSDNNKVEDMEKEDVNTDDSASENKIDAEEDKSEKVDTEEEKVETKEEVKTDKEVEDTKAEDTQEEVKEDAQDEVKEETQNDETQNDNNEQQDNQADVKAEPTQTEQVVAMSDSEARIQELQAKLEGNLFQNMFSKLSV